MTPDELQYRTTQFALRIMKAAETVSRRGIGARELAKQLVRSGMSVSANYRAARRLRSKKEFIARIGVVTEESDEVQHRLDLAVGANYVSSERMKPLQAEAGELVAIFSSTVQTARRRATADPSAGRRPNRQITRSPDYKISPRVGMTT